MGPLDWLFKTKDDILITRDQEINQACSDIFNSVTSRINTAVVQVLIPVPLPIPVPVPIAINDPIKLEDLYIPGMKV